MLRARQVHILFQPIVDLTAGDVMGYEALGRGACEGLSPNPTDLFRLAADRRALGGMPPIPDEVGNYDIALVHQRPFDLADLGQRKRLKQQQRLSSYGWVDREKGQIHIPIDVAIQRRIGEAKR